jgi:hypothetical protein
MIVFQFRPGQLPNLFVFGVLPVLSVACIVATSLAVLRSTVQQREHAIERLRELGASVSFDYEWDKDGWWISDSKPPGNYLLKQIRGKHYAVEPLEIQLFEGLPTMRPTAFTDDDAALLTCFPKLKWIVLFDTGLTDKGLRSLQLIPALERLDVERTLVTEQGVREFQEARPDVKIFF